jgi:hypothetical protein
MWPSYKGANNWRISQLVPRTAEDEKGAQNLVVGTRIGAFKMAEIWHGEGGLEGQRYKFETLIKTVALVAKATIKEKLPGRGRLQEEALKMIDKTLNWYATVHQLFDAELQKLTQVHILKGKCLILLWKKQLSCSQ